MKNSQHVTYSPSQEGEKDQPYLLVAENIQKKYGDKLVLKNLSFSLKPSRILGFLGPNGAGKTTAIRILTTIIEPTAGKFAINGVQMKEKDQLRQLIGVLPESHGFPDNMTAIEYLIYFGRLYGLDKEEAFERSNNLLREVGLEKRANSLISSFSRGMKQRLGISRALINDPLILFLDEPTLGLDPMGQKELLLLLDRLATERKTGIILCSHLLDEVEEVCDDVVILRSGEVVASGAIDDIIRNNQSDSIRVNVPMKHIEEAMNTLKDDPSLQITRPKQSSGWLEIRNQDSEMEQKELEVLNNKILTRLMDANIPILNFNSGGGRLQQAFLHLTKEMEGN